MDAACCARARIVAASVALAEGLADEGKRRVGGMHDEGVGGGMDRFLLTEGRTPGVEGELENLNSPSQTVEGALLPAGEFHSDVGAIPP